MISEARGPWRVVGNPEVKSRVASLNFSTDGLLVTRQRHGRAVNEKLLASTMHLDVFVPTLVPPVPRWASLPLESALRLHRGEIIDKATGRLAHLARCDANCYCRRSV